MVEITDTAAAIARVRAEESERPLGERLFEDPLAPLFTGGAAGEEALRLMMRVPGLREYVRTRTRFLDDAVRGALAGGIGQIVLLGAGYDTRALRLQEIAAGGATVFEIDLATQLATKREILDRGGIEIPSWLHWVATDFNAEGWEAALLRDLERHGLDTRERALFVWEGVIGYLDDTAVDRSLGFMARAGGLGSCLALNYPVMRFPVADLAALLARAGFAIVEDEAVGALYRRYVPGDREPGDDLFRLAIAELR